MVEIIDFHMVYMEIKENEPDMERGESQAIFTNKSE